MQGVDIPFSESPQERFDRSYISSSEIIQELKISRTALLYARRKGKLPEPIVISETIMVWERDTVMPFLITWKNKLNARRGTNAS